MTGKKKGRMKMSQSPKGKGGSYAQQIANPFSYLEIKNQKQGNPL